MAEKLKKIDNYITDMKELPPKAHREVKKSVLPPMTKEITVDKNSKLSKQSDNPLAQDVEKTKTQGNKISSKAKKEPGLFSAKDVVLGFINTVTVVFLIFILTKLPQKSLELKNEKISEFKSEANYESRMNLFEEEKKKSDRLEQLFLDEDGAVSFVRDIDNLKVPGSTIKGVTFGSQLAVRDKLGLYGLPATIEMEGGWQAIGIDLEKIQKLPYLFRPVKIDINLSKDDPAVVFFSYGGILYVNDKFERSKN